MLTAGNQRDQYCIVCWISSSHISITLLFAWCETEIIVLMIKAMIKQYNIYQKDFIFIWNLEKNHDLVESIHFENNFEDWI